jgi:diaminohydroxyphosphoribosylaminopyrimidine deaminase/5-amino-6-(5-phosphoribosylamino)uracil reductase
VLDTELRLPRKSQLVRTAGEVPTWIFCARSAALSRSRALEKAGCRVSRVRLARGAVALGEVLDRLGAANMTNVLVEGGGQVLGRFVDEQLADEVQAYVAPLLIGGATAPGVLGARGCERISQAPRLLPDGPPQRLGSCWLFAGRL